MSPLVLLGALGCSRDPLGAVEFEGAPAPFEGQSPDAFGQWTSFDTSPSGDRLTMAYYDRVRGAVGYAVGTPTGDGFEWVHELVDGYVGDNGLDSGDRGRHASQRTMKDGTVWVAYEDTTNRTLRARHRLAPGEWEESADIDDAGTGKWATMSLDAGGNPLIVHCTEDGRVRESRGNDGGWTHRDLYTSPGGLVEHSKLLIADGHEYIVFRDAAAGELHLLTDGRDEVVDGGDTGAWATIAVDGTTTWIAYQDVDDQDLRVAKSAGSSWELSTVDDGELRGADTALLVDDQGATMLYFDGFDNDLRAARPADGSWQTDRLAGDTVAAGFFNRFVEFGGETWWFSYDRTNDLLLSGRL